MRNYDVPAGTLVCFSTGEYSDYSITGHFVTLQDLNQSIFEEIKEIAAKRHDDLENIWDEWSSSGRHGDEPEYSSNPHEVFISEMIRRGFLLSINVSEFHIGSYGRIEL